MQDGFRILAEQDHLRVTVFKETDGAEVYRCVFVTETSSECSHCGKGGEQLGLASWDVLDFEEQVIQPLESSEDRDWVRKVFHDFLIAEATNAGRMFQRV